MQADPVDDPVRRIGPARRLAFIQKSVVFARIRDQLAVVIGASIDETKGAPYFRVVRRNIDYAGLDMAKMVIYGKRCALDGVDLAWRNKA